jgi:hypothetical protein
MVINYLYKKTRRVPPTFKKPHIYMAEAAVLLRTSAVTRKRDPGEPGCSLSWSNQDLLQS